MSKDNRFWSKTVDMGSCITWTAGLSSNGYGAFWQDGRTQRAHVIAFERYYGYRPKQPYVVTHLCHTRDCVNPLHLAARTQRDNVKDSIREGTHRTPFVDGNKCARIEGSLDNTDPAILDDLLDGQDIDEMLGKR